MALKKAEFLVQRFGQFNYQMQPSREPIMAICCDAHMKGVAATATPRISATRPTTDVLPPPEEPVLLTEFVSVGCLNMEEEEEENGGEDAEEESDTEGASDSSEKSMSMLHSAASRGPEMEKLLLCKPTNESGRGKFHCLVCRRTKKNKRRLLRHLTYVHFREEIMAKHRKEILQKKCDSCDKKFPMTKYTLRILKK